MESHPYVIAVHGGTANEEAFMVINGVLDVGVPDGAGVRVDRFGRVTSLLFRRVLRIVRQSVRALRVSARSSVIRTLRRSAGTPQEDQSTHNETQQRIHALEKRALRRTAGSLDLT